MKEAGEILVVERGRNKAYCRIVWIGDSTSRLHGQVGIQCVEAEKTLWTAELRDMEEIYDPIVRDGDLHAGIREKPGWQPPPLSPFCRQRCGRIAARGAVHQLSGR